MRAALYTRVSTDEQAREGVSLAAQREALVAFCRSQGWDVADVYTDDGFSGKNLDRPAMQRLLRDVAAKAVDVVLVYRLDRLSRRQRDVLHLIEDVFDLAGVGFRSATESFDTTTPAGKAMLGMLSVFAQLERETIVERTRMGKAQAAKEGRWKGGYVTFGYRYEPGTDILQVDPLTAPTVRLAFDLYVTKAMGFEAIARYLSGENPDGRKYTTPRGAPQWRLAAVRYLLRNPAYAGYSVHKGALHEGRHEPLVPRDVWEAAQRIRQGRADGQAAKKAALLSGVLRCAECGGKMRSKKQWVNWPKEPKRYHRNYVCYNYLGEPSHLVTRPCGAGYRHAEHLEADVLAELERLSMDDRLIDETAAELVAATSEAGADLQLELAAIDGRRADLRRRLDRWYAAFEGGDVDLPQLRERIASLQDEDAQLAARSEQARAAVLAAQERGAEAELLKGRLRQLRGLLTGGEPAEVWAVVHALVKEIWVAPDGRITDIRFL